MRLETRERRQRKETGDMRKEMGNRRKETGERRRKAVDRRRERVLCSVVEWSRPFFLEPDLYLKKRYKQNFEQ